MKKITGGILALLLMLLFTQTQALTQTRDRSEVPDKYKWDLTDLYSSDELWYEAKNKISEQIEALYQFKGSLSESSAKLLACLKYSNDILKELRHLSSYSWNKARQDLRDSYYRAMDQETNQLNTKYNANASFIQPEILSMDKKTIQNFFKTEPALKPYAFFLNDIMRLKKHVLSEDAEKVIAEAGWMSQATSSVYNALISAGLTHSKVKLSTGQVDTFPGL